MSTQYRFGPREPGGVFLGVRAGQLGVGVGASLVSVVLVGRWPSLPGALAALTILIGAAAGVLLPVGGRSLQEWAGVAARYAVDELLGEHRWIAAQQLRGHDLAVALPSSRGELTDPRPAARSPRLRRHRSIDALPSEHDAGSAADAGRWVLDVRRVDGGEVQPPYLRGVQMLAVRWHQGEIGVVKDSRAHTYVGVIAASGRGFALLDHGEKARLLEQWGRALAAAARQGSALSRVQWLERTVPDDSESVVEHLRAGCAVDSSSPFVRSYLEVVDAAGPQTQHHEVYLALEVSAWRASPVTRQRHAGADVASCEALSRELDAFADHLHQAEVEVRGILSPRLLASVLRTAADPGAREASADRAAVDPDLAGASPRTAMPRRSQATWSRLRTEGTWQATYWVSEWPRVAVDGDWMTPLLLGTRCRRTVSVVMRPCSGATALRRVEAARVDEATTQSFRERLGFPRTVRSERQADSIDRDERDLNEGHACYRVSAYVTVTAATSAELGAACTDVEQQARRAGLDLRLEYGTQDVAFTYTLPLCRGVR